MIEELRTNTKIVNNLKVSTIVGAFKRGARDAANLGETSYRQDISCEDPITVERAMEELHKDLPVENYQDEELRVTW